MNEDAKKSYLERIQRMSSNYTLRLWIEILSVFAMLAVIGYSIAIIWFGHPWLAIFNLTWIPLIYVLRRLAILIVDIADMVIEQRTVEESKDDKNAV